MAILNHIISSLKSSKKSKKEKGPKDASQKFLKTKPLGKTNNLSPKEKSILEKLNSTKNPQDFKSQLLKISSLTTLERIRPFISAFEKGDDQSEQWINNAYNQLLFQKVSKSAQINEEVFEALEKINQEDKIVKIFLEKDFGPLREKALAKIKTQESFTRMAKKISSPKWGQKLIDNISDPDTLLDLSSSASHKKIRSYAKEKRESLLKQSDTLPGPQSRHDPHSLKLLGEKVQNFLSHYSESLAEAFLSENRKIFQNEKEAFQNGGGEASPLLEEIEKNLQVIEENIQVKKKREACFLKANEIIEEYQKCLLSGDKITLKHSQQIQDEWDQLSWETVESSDRENLSKRFFLLLEKVTDKDLDKLIMNREKIIKKLETLLDVFPPIETEPLKNDREWNDFFNQWKHLEKEWDYLTKGIMQDEDIPSTLNEKKQKLNQFVEENKKAFKKHQPNHKLKTRLSLKDKLSKLNPNELLEQLQKTLKSKDNNKNLYKEVVSIRERWEVLLKSSSSSTKELKPTFESLLKGYFEKQDKLLQEKEWEEFSNERKRKGILESLKLLIEKESTQGLGNKLKDFQKEWKSLKARKSKEKSLLDKEFHELIQKAVDICIQEKTNILAKLKEVLKEKASLFPSEQNQNDQIGEKPSETDKMTPSSDPILSKSFINDNLETVKELQKAFALSGPIPNNFKSDVISSFQRMCQFFFDQRKLHSAYSEVKREENYQLKLKLFEKTKELIEKEKELHEGDNVKKIISLQKEWKTIGPVPKNKQDELWDKFQKICHDFFHYLDQQKQGNQVKKEKICQEMKQITDNLGEDTHFKEMAQNVKDLQKKWKNIGPLPKEVDDILWKKFRGHCDTFFDFRDKFLKDRQIQYLENESLKRALLNELDQVEQLESWKEKTDQVINIQKKWRDIGPATKNSEQEIWSEFKSRCDQFFSKKKSFFNEQNEAKKDNLLLKEDICWQLEAIFKLAFPEREESIVNESSNVAKQLDWGLKLKTEIIVPGDQFKTQKRAIQKVIELQKVWKTIGRVPQEKEEALWTRFRSLAALFFSSEKKN